MPVHLTGRWTRVSEVPCPEVLARASTLLAAPDWGLSWKPAISLTAQTASFRSLPGDPAGVLDVSLICVPALQEAAAGQPLNSLNSLALDVSERLNAGHHPRALAGLRALARGVSAASSPPPTPADLR